MLATASQQLMINTINISGLDNSTWKLQPLSFESTGGFDKPSSLLINNLANSISARFGIPSSVIQRSIVNELSIILTKGAARLVLRRMVEKEPLKV